MAQLLVVEQERPRPLLSAKGLKFSAGPPMSFLSKDMAPGSHKKPAGQIGEPPVFKRKPAARMP